MAVWAVIRRAPRGLAPSTMKNCGRVPNRTIWTRSPITTWSPDSSWRMWGISCSLGGWLLASTGERMTLSASLQGTFWTVQLSSTETWALSRVMLSICTSPLPS